MQVIISQYLSNLHGCLIPLQNTSCRLRWYPLAPSSWSGPGLGLFLAAWQSVYSAAWLWRLWGLSVKGWRQLYCFCLLPHHRALLSKNSTLRSVLAQELKLVQIGGSLVRTFSFFECSHPFAPNKAFLFWFNFLFPIGKAYQAFPPPSKWWKPLIAFLVGKIGVKKGTKALATCSNILVSLSLGWR